MRGQRLRARAGQLPAYRIYRTTGKSLRGPFNINDLFNVGAKEFTSDPRCWFDPSTQTWFATILFLNDASTASSLLIAVRHNADPRGLWNEYSIDTTDPSGNGCPCFGDQPRIGIDQANLYVTADEFSILGPQFNGAECGRSTSPTSSKALRARTS